MPIKTLYLRNAIFGAEDSLVSTVGILYGMAAAGINSATITVTGIILVCVEALSMGVGSYLSEDSSNHANHVKTKANPILGGLIMFLFYFLAGLIPLTPYFVWEQNLAKNLSVLFTLIGLFFLGYLPTKKIKLGLKMLFIAGAAIVVGYIVGVIFGVNGK